MATYPETPRADFLLWCQAHAPLFTAHAAAIGLTPAQAAAYTSACTAGAAAILAQDTAQQAARNATATMNAAMDELRALTGDAVRLIRAFAESQVQPATVYQLASIPAPAQPSPLPPPARPSDLTVTLDATTGQLTLRWKATNPHGSGGTTYLIRRKVEGQSQFAFIGTSSGRKMFVDATLAAGPDSVQYTVQGQRSGVSGPPSPVCTVHFGRSAGAHAARPSEPFVSMNGSVNGSSTNGHAHAPAAGAVGSRW